MTFLSPFLRATILAGAAFATFPAAAQTGRFGGGDRTAWFDKADANRDGRVSRAEFDNFRMAQFGQLDRNGDGVVSPADFPRLAKARPDSYARLTGILDQADGNGDGVISRAEMRAAPPRLFLIADADRNNDVSRAEFDAARERMKAALAARRQ
ncbi:Ca2+ sensor (EF-Hand superfamily) [Sphingobium indicum BiD32]|uniref:Ca2+ sensor (EF-Hand superfamily) n=1 Tax=Sphingobium indicum BiD32 TaxID=1301087 RepID=N1MG59_9SPHN|nr:Ca2+ sensor (EF-Hand superfamily) [Sphingobium indicum]CCW15739.1 Ca2+ sensor (EF-Hand superfamily) [Sphingobium indicum BiD32]